MADFDDAHHDDGGEGRLHRAVAAVHVAPVPAHLDLGAVALALKMRGERCERALAAEPR